MFDVAEAGQKASNHGMKTFLLIFAVAAFTFGLSAAETNSLVPLKISAAAATNYYDQEMIVTGKVAQVTVRPTITFLNLDKAYPNSPFAVVIFHGKSSYYGDANALKGKQIEISGKIIKYKDKPEIALDTTNQLTVLNFTNSVTKAKRKVKAPAISAPGNALPVEPSTNGFPEIM
jgi:DNA/RNA endonuclease YhcR with UshA esterase domain